jgi:hypothetical protein
MAIENSNYQEQHVAQLSAGDVTGYLERLDGTFTLTMKDSDESFIVRIASVDNQGNVGLAPIRRGQAVIWRTALSSLAAGEDDYAQFEKIEDKIRRNKEISLKELSPRRDQRRMTGQ